MSKKITAKIDLTKIDKNQIFVGKKGKYINLDIWVNDEVDQFGQDTSIKQSWKNGENYEGVYIGNGKSWLNNQSGQTPENNNNNDLPF